MKLAVTGKGGVGKTTVCALLAAALHELGRRVLAIDADPDSNLAACLGHPAADTVRPLVELKDLIEERTGAKPGTMGGMFRLNPFVADLPDRYAVELAGVRVLVAGAVKEGGTGCYCPENALVRALIGHVLTDPDTDLVLDMEAGIEHLTRGTVRQVDHLLIVVNPGRRSLETAARIGRLAQEVGLPQVSIVGNRTRDDEDDAFIHANSSGLPVLGTVREDPAVQLAERRGDSVVGASAAVTESVRRLAGVLGGHATPTG